MELLVEITLRCNVTKYAKSQTLRGATALCPQPAPTHPFAPGQHRSPASSHAWSYAACAAWGRPAGRRRAQGRRQPRRPDGTCRPFNDRTAGALDSTCTQLHATGVAQPERLPGQSAPSLRMHKVLRRTARAVKMPTSLSMSPVMNSLKDGRRPLGGTTAHDVELQLVDGESIWVGVAKVLWKPLRGGAGDRAPVQTAERVVAEDIALDWL